MEPATLHTSTRIPVTDEPIVSWRAIPEATTAHAFRDSGPGWMTSVCGSERFTFRCELAPGDFPRCLDCGLALYGTPGEVMEAWGK
ncbi:MAG: hypothetical protein WAN48_10715 [Actinomycetes bacterium]